LAATVTDAHQGDARRAAEIGQHLAQELMKLRVVNHSLNLPVQNVVTRLPPKWGAGLPEHPERRFGRWIRCPVREEWLEEEL
jgi:hypothetical protein